MRANGQNKPTRENILAKKEQKSRPSAKVWKTKEQKGGAYTEKHHYKKKPLQKKTKKKQELQQQTTGRKTHMLLHSNQGAQGNRCNILMCVRTLQSATKRHDCLFIL